MMLYCYPELIDMDAIVDEPQAEFPPYDVFPVKAEWVPSTGSLSSPRGATSEMGKILVEELSSSSPTP